MKKLLSVLICLGLVFSFVPVQLLAADDTTDVTVTIVWEDNDDAKGLRPDEVEVNLYDGGETDYNEHETVTPDAQGNWKVTFKDVPKDIEAELNVLDAEEPVTIPGYTSFVSGDLSKGFTITMMIPEGTILDIPVTVKWDDNNDEKGKRPNSVDILYDTLEDECDTETITANDNWCCVLTGVPSNTELYLDGEENGVYPPDGYTYEITGDPISGYTITFTIIDLTETTTIKGKIVWEDDNNKKKIRPGSIEVVLNGYIESDETYEFTSSSYISAESDWTYKFENVPVYNTQGNTYSYHLSPIVPSWYDVDLADGEVLEFNQDNETVVNLKDDNSLGVYVAGKAVTAENASNVFGDGSVKYDDKTKTLTLKDFVSKFDNPSQIETYKDITIDVKGENFLAQAKPDSAVILQASLYDNVITTYGLSNITLKGDGDLNIYCHHNGIVAKNVTIDMTGKLNIMEYGAPHFCAIKADGGTITIKNGVIDLYSHISYCLYADKIDIQGGYILLRSAAGTITNVKPTIADDLRVSVGDSEDMLAAGSAEDLLKDHKCAKIVTSDPGKSPKPEETPKPVETPKPQDNPKLNNVPQTGVNSTMNVAIAGILCFDLAVFLVLMMIRKKVEL